MSTRLTEAQFAERVMKGRPKARRDSLIQLKRNAIQELEILAGQKNLTIDQALVDAEETSIRTDWHKKVARLERLINFRNREYDEKDLVESNG